MKSENRNRDQRTGSLLISVLIPLLVGAFSALLTSSAMKTYGSMQHPPLSPPAWVFPVVWTFLYLLMGTAAYLVRISTDDSRRMRKAFALYAAQLIMNFFWSILFFKYGLYLIAFIWLLVMWLLTIMCAVRFYRINRAAGSMMWLLVMWTTFAAYLNLASYIISIAPAAA